MELKRRYSSQSGGTVPGAPNYAHPCCNDRSLEREREREREVMCRNTRCATPSLYLREMLCDASCMLIHGCCTELFIVQRWLHITPSNSWQFLFDPWSWRSAIQASQVARCQVPQITPIHVATIDHLRERGRLCVATHAAQHQVCT